MTTSAALPPAIRKAVLWALLVGLAIMAARHAAVGYLANTAPAVALRLDGGDPVVLLTDMEQQLLMSRGADLSPAELRDRGRQILGGAPLSVGGLRLMGIAAAAQGNARDALKLMHLATRVSRRDLGTNAWMIEERVSAGDVAGALDRYDLALSTDQRAPAVLFPVLTAALGEPQIATAFMPWIGRERPWMPSFLEYAIANGEAPAALADLILKRGGLPRAAAYRPLDTLLLRRLEVARQYSTAYRYALSLPGVRPSVMTDPGFTRDTLDSRLAPLTWQLSNPSDTRAQQDDDGRVAVFAQPNANGVAAIRFLFLKPGTYRFHYTVEPVPNLDPVSLSWEMRCAPRHEDLAWRQEVPASDEARKLTSSIAIPARCPVQQMSLVATGRDSQSEGGVRVGPLVLDTVSIAAGMRDRTVELAAAASSR
ncbi:hypothetical protein [Sphingomonas sp.]|uniref:hypothetical protein n=1 Tax=Sphingomonas sp. TaxID=28214 RepID=UPI002DD68790|nr:hypothetical protein [Sphingomonas sp.]